MHTQITQSAQTMEPPAPASSVDGIQDECCLQPEKEQSAGPMVQPSLDGQPVPDRKRKRTWFGFARDLFLYVLVYVAVSGILIGPLFWEWFGAVYVDGPKWIARVYMPLLLLCEIIPPLGWLINLWINWWIL